MRKIYLFLILLFTCSLSFAQQNVYLKINHNLGTSPFQLSQTASNNNGEQFNVSRLEYYISQIILVHDGGTETTVSNTWLLVNATTQLNELLGSFPITNLEGIKFGIGVEQAVNHLDPSSYPSTHPLAPQSPSMHWGWSAGYRFVAMEGNSGNNLNQIFQIHALEDNNYFEASLTTTGYMNGNDLVIELDADYEKALQNISVNQGLINHGGTGEAISLLRNFQQYVFTPSSNTVGIAPSVVQNHQLILYPNPTINGFNISGDFPRDSRLSIASVLGEVVMDQEYVKGHVSTKNLSPGLYFVSIAHKGQDLAIKKLIINQ